MYAANTQRSPKYLENSAPLPPYFFRKIATGLLSHFYLNGHCFYCAYFLLLFTLEHLVIVTRDCQFSKILSPSRLKQSKISTFEDFVRSIGLLRYTKLNPNYLLFSFSESFLVFERKCENS